MLTATYTLVALSVEQASVRVSLLAFQHYVRSTLMRQNRLSLHQLEYACATLDQLYQACHWRKIEMYLIPAIRAATERADQLLDELGRLNQSALGVIRALQRRLGDGDELQTQVAQTCAGIEAFCAALLQRLEREEKELFAIARRVIGGEAWFAIAHQFMVHDARVEEERRARPAAVPKTALSVWPGHAGAAAPAPGGGGAATASADSIAADNIAADDEDNHDKDNHGEDNHDKDNHGEDNHDEYNHGEDNHGEDNDDEENDDEDNGDGDGDAVPRDVALEPAIPDLVALPIPGAAALSGAAPHFPRRQGAAGRATAE